MAVGPTIEEMAKKFAYSIHGDANLNVTIKHMSLIVVEGRHGSTPLVAVVDNRTWLDKLFGKKPFVIEFSREPKEMVKTGLMHE